jgi:hypothetical protein
MSNPNIKDFGWKKGQSGNPAGRPKREWSMATLIEDALNEIDATSGLNWKQLVVKRLLTLAIGGDMNAIREINDRIDGRAKQSIDISGDTRLLPVTLEELKTNYGELAAGLLRQLEGQVVEDGEPVQDKRQTGEDSGLPSESNPNPTPSGTGGTPPESNSQS